MSRKMRKYSRPSIRGKGQAWFRQFSMGNPTRVAWHKYFPDEKGSATRPNPGGSGVTMDSFAAPGNQFSYVEVEVTKQISVRLTDEMGHPIHSQRLTLFYKTHECWFVWEYLDTRIKFTSRTYPTRKEALTRHLRAAIRWIKHESM